MNMAVFVICESSHFQKLILKLSEIINPAKMQMIFHFL